MSHATNQEIFEDYQMDMRYRSLSKHTIRFRIDDIKQFLAFFPDKSVSKAEFIPRDIKEYILSFKESEEWTSPYTFARNFCSIKTFFNFAVENNYLSYKDNPIICLKSPKVPKSRHLKPLTRDEVRQIEKVANIPFFKGKPHKAIFLTLFSTGLRKGEMLGIKRDENLNLDTGMIYIPPENTKGMMHRREGRAVQLSPQAIEAVKEYMLLDKSYHSEYLFHTKRGKKLDPRIVNEFMNELIRMAFPSEWKKQTGTHILRRTFATFWIEEGGDLQALKRFMGWSSLSVLDFYENVSREFLQKEAKKMHTKIHKSVWGNRK